MILWVRIAGAPARQYFRDVAALEHMTASEPRHGLLVDVPALRAGVEGENAHARIALQNGDGQCVALFADPPLGAAVTVYGRSNGATESLFTGTVHAVALGALCEIEAQA